jgi:chemotaxis protein histidine kinase CheA
VVTSTLGQGSTFSIFLPLTTGSATFQAQQQTPAQLAN